jgi:formate/nitrite transporter FocA (FNT family)
MADFSLGQLLRLGRLWGIVLAANLVGTILAAAFCVITPVVSHDIFAAMLAVSRHAMAKDFASMFFHAITAGFLIAAMVWLMPSAESAQPHIIVLMTWLIAVGNFSHVIAGSVESFLLVLNGELGFGAMLVHFTIPALLGNIVGGTALFALLSYAQVMKEI